MRKILSQFLTQDQLDSLQESKRFMFTLKAEETHEKITQVKSTQRNLDVTNLQIDSSYSITVKNYMTKEASPTFDFMAQWNNNKPMPLIKMSGRVLKRTPKMAYMELRGKAEETCNCLRCNRPLSNDLSRYYGIGPECAQKLGIQQIQTDDIVQYMKARINEVTWTGWVILTAITKCEKL